MRQQGVDIFPDCDSHCYIEGLPLKDIATERHLYYCMALTANSLRKHTEFRYIKVSL
jgi:hypothetical protein